LFLVAHAGRRISSPKRQKGDRERRAARQESDARVEQRDKEQYQDQRVERSNQKDDNRQKTNIDEMKLIFAMQPPD